MYKYDKKKIISVVICLLMFTSLLSFLPQKTGATFDPNVESAILVDGQTGKILFEKNADIELGIASMSKMMTEYLILEAIHENKMSWDQTVLISEWVAKLSHDAGGSNVFLEVDGSYTVRDLYEAIAIESANAATIALAEFLGGDYANFVTLMNQKAGELNLEKYLFVNSTGLPNRSYKGNHAEGTSVDDENRLSARDTIRLAYHLVNDFPEVLETSSIPMKYFQGEIVTDKNWMECKEDWTCMKNWNDMLPELEHYYEGLDGLKTGYTNLAKYTFTGTAMRDNTRLISVVMGAEKIDTRFVETAKILDYGFSNFEQLDLSTSIEVQVIKGKEKELMISPSDPFTVMVKAGESELYSPFFELDNSLLDEEGNLIAPIEAGQVVGWLTYEYSGEDIFTYLTEDGHNKERVPVIADETVEKANWFSLTMRAIGGFFSGIWTSVADTVKGLFS
jgi:D-alanyl-D-alanine carboxypeptidase (penicillin-binding protein 5/6)